MVSLKDLQQQEMYSNKTSFLHEIDGRIKLIVLVLVIIFAVSTENFLVLTLLELYLLTLIILSKISFKDAMKRVIVILPFGLFMGLFQPFIHPGTILYTLPLGITITKEGLLFGELLISRFFISITSIVLFSYITPMQEIAKSFRKLGMPKEFAMIFSLFVRFIFLFYDQLTTIRQAQTTRGFSLKNNTPYLWKVKQVGYLFLMMFLKSYEQGENVFNSMASRGYNYDSILYDDNEKLSKNSILYLTITILIIIILEFCLLIRIL